VCDIDLAVERGDEKGKTFAEAAAAANYIPDRK
jgi:hypothetical protein